MSNNLIWFLVPLVGLILPLLVISFRQRKLNFDREEYLLAGRRLSPLVFALSTTTLTLLGVMTLAHAGLVYRSGMAYGYLGPMSLLVPLMSAFFARRLWILSHVFNTLTPAQLLGGYYRSTGIRTILAVIAALVAFILLFMSLRLGADVTGKLVTGIAHIRVLDLAGGWSLPITTLSLVVISLLVLVLAIIGGMGAIGRMAAYTGFMTLAALFTLAVVIVWVDGASSFLKRFFFLQESRETDHLFALVPFYPSLHDATLPENAWPGALVVSSFLALAGLALTPAALMNASSTAKARSFERQQLLWSGGMVGFVFLSVILLLAGLPYLLPVGLFPDLTAGSKDIKDIVGALILHMSLSPVHFGLTSLALFSLVMALTLAATAALLTASAHIADLTAKRGSAKSSSVLSRKTIMRLVMLLLVVPAALTAFLGPLDGKFAASLLTSAQRHDLLDPLPLFLLAGALGLQLLPALAGLCYFEGLTARPVILGALAGIIAVLLTSPLGVAGAHSLLQQAGLSLPWTAWPQGLHPAYWGLLANLIFVFATPSSKRERQDSAHRRTYHRPPNDAPLMAPDAPGWQMLAALAAFLWLLITVGALAGLRPAFNLFAPLPSLWTGYVLSWLIGLFLIYIVAYKLQPLYDPLSEPHHGHGPAARRYRVKAGSRPKKDGEAA